MADFLGMMKQAAQLQSKMQAMQEELGHVEVEGSAGGGLVSVRMTAKMEVKAVKIDPAPQGGSRDAGENAGADRRAAIAAGAGPRLTCPLPSPVPKSNA